MDRVRKSRHIQTRKELGKTDSHRTTVQKEIQKELLSSDVSINEITLKEIFQNCSDVVFRPIQLHERIKLLLIYVDGLVDTKILDHVVLKPVMFEGLPDGLETALTFGQVLEKQLVPISQIKIVSEISDTADGILHGNVVFLADGDPYAIIADLRGFEKRAVSEPAAEPVIRGPREGFTETLRTNTSLLRRKIRSPQLKMESFTLGKYTKTDIEITYIEGIASEQLIKEVRKRVSEIQIDGVLESGYIEEFIEDTPWSPFPTVQNSERPDVVAASVLEGKVAILVDGTPFVLIVPMTFWVALQAAEDHYERFIVTSFIRWVRMFFLNVALFLPALYVALTVYHPQLIPTGLAISIASAQEQSPFPTVIETLLMVFMFEGLREAGIRLPKPVGSAVSIVGALVLGEAAVQAGIVSAPIVIVVATTGIASFAIPRYNLGLAYRILVFPMIILAGILGLFGVWIMGFAILIHLVSLRSFGIPYLSPIAPQIPGEMRDVLFRAPRWSMHLRPTLTGGRNPTRIPKGQQPSLKRGKRNE